MAKDMKVKVQGTVIRRCIYAYQKYHVGYEQ